MRALRFHGREDLRTETIDEPSPGPGEVKLRNAFNGLCGSDLHCYFNPESLGFDFSVPHPLTGATLPQVFGHESQRWHVAASTPPAGSRRCRSTKPITPCASSVPGEG